MALLRSGGWSSQAVEEDGCQLQSGKFSLNAQPTGSPPS